MSSVPSNGENDRSLGLVQRCLTAASVGVVVVLVIGVAAFLTTGKTGVEKNFTALCYPVGLAWFLTLCFACSSLLLSRGRSGWWLLVFAVAIYVFGTRPLANMALKTLEDSFVAFAPDDDAPLDALIVLGGGTTTGPARSQAATAGDRVLYAAQLYHQGKTARLITTGAATPGSANSAASPSAQTVEIWTKLGIPESDIEQLEGINTFEELSTLSDELATGEAARIGLLTSAFHIPRALRLAESRDLAVIPVGADYRANANSPARIVPHSENLLKWETALHEYLAYIVAR